MNRKSVCVWFEYPCCKRVFKDTNIEVPKVEPTCHNSMEYKKLSLEEVMEEIHNFVDSIGPNLISINEFRKNECRYGDLYKHIWSVWYWKDTSEIHQT